MTYDQWKTTDPRDYYGYDYEDEHDPQRDCDHEDYEIDVCTGRAECDYCSHAWYLSSAEIDAELDRQARYHDDMERENRRQWWMDKTYPARMFIFRILERVWPRKALSVLTDDEIPF